MRALRELRPLMITGYLARFLADRLHLPSFSDAVPEALTPAFVMVGEERPSQNIGDEARSRKDT
jgi:hypothetical protein